MPFNLRNFEEEAKAKMGVVECVSHKLIEPFNVLYEKHSEYRVHKLDIVPHSKLFHVLKKGYAENIFMILRGNFLKELQYTLNMNQLISKA